MNNNSCCNNYKNDIFNSYYSNCIHFMPPPFIVAPCLSPYPFYYTYHNNNNNNKYIENNNNNKFASASTSETKRPTVDTGTSFSVSRQFNADSGSSGTYVAVRDSSSLSDVRATTESSRIGVTVANGETIFSSHTGYLTLPSGHLLRAHIFPCYPSVT